MFEAGFWVGHSGGLFYIFRGAEGGREDFETVRTALLAPHQAWTVWVGKAGVFALCCFGVVVLMQDRIVGIGCGFFFMDGWAVRIGSCVGFGTGFIPRGLVQGWTIGICCRSRCGG